MQPFVRHPTPSPSLPPARATQCLPSLMTRVCCPRRLAVPSTAHTQLSTRTVAAWRTRPAFSTSFHTNAPSDHKTSLAEFQLRYFELHRPCLLSGLYSAAGDDALPAIRKWFTLLPSGNISVKKEYLGQHDDHVVPLELTGHAPAPVDPGPNTHDRVGQTFTRIEDSFTNFVDYLQLAIARIEQRNTPQLQNQPDSNQQSASPHFYLAQHSLSNLPATLRADLPTPELVSAAGKGDVYDSSIWLGLAPTCTPLHRDPNPNLLVQIAGTKRVRMLAPGIGREVFEQWIRGESRTRESDSRGSANVRGEEMMSGAQRERAESWLWGDVDGLHVGRGGDGGFARVKGDERFKDEWFEAELGVGDALFVPVGWWHGIRGIGRGLSGSVNWWFR